MSDWMQSGSHQAVAEYLYDVASQQDENVPEPAASHIRRCPSCRGRVVRLKEAVFGGRTQANERQSSMDHNVIDTLDSHFQHRDEEVTCSRIRPFLPGLLDPSVELRIPTPITVHLDHCPRCADDLRNLRDLALSGEQLRKLQGLYGREPAGGLLLCRRARSRIAAFVRGSLEGIDGDVLNHLSTCPRCRADVYSRRQAILNESGETPGGGCDGVSAAGLFDYVVPHADSAGRIKQSEGLHVGTCRRCLETMQAIHRVIYDVVERPESGVATVYRTVEDDRILATRADEPYAGYGVAVEVVHREPGQARARGRMVLRKATANPHVRRILKTAVPAAALIPLAALFFYTHGGSGITLGEVVRAFGQAKNVRVMVYSPVADAITYEVWVARKLDLLGIITEKSCVVYDLSRKQKSDLGSGRTSPIEEAELFRMREIADGYLGFRLGDVPNDAGWDHVGSDGNRGIYELSWMKQTYTGRAYEGKCEMVIDTSTRLPASSCVFRWEPAEARWACKSVTVFEYLSEAEMVSLMAGKPVSGPDSHRRKD